LRQIKLYIEGMTCINCQNKIEKELRKRLGIEKISVSYENGTVDIYYDENEISPDKMITLIDDLGYQASLERASGKKVIWITIRELLVIIALFLLLQYFGILNYLTPSSLADSGMGYGMLFIIGLITSVHCIAMCGGINLSQTLYKETQDISQVMFKNTFEYNIGRVVSYTVIGGILGAIGSLTGIVGNLQTSTFLQGILKLLAGIIMVIMGANMLGLFPAVRKLKVRIPFLSEKIMSKGRRTFWGKKIATKRRTPFVIGVCNGFMPCGPLQSMQIIALASGNAFAGALSMFCFSIGTVPLMLGFGTFISMLGKRFTRQVLRAGGILVVVMGLSMMSQGNALAGFENVFTTGTGEQILNATKAGNTDIAVEKDGTQYISSTLQSGKYPDITVKAGEPVKWTIEATKEDINGCNYKAVLQNFGVEQVFEEGKNVIEFTPTEAGTYTYSCWMGMITGTVHVEE